MRSIKTMSTKEIIKNINWDDETVCNLCGKKEPCKCYDEFYCPCGKKNKDCEWPENIGCPCRACHKVYSECMCDKPPNATEEAWKVAKVFKYNCKYDWDKDNFKHEED